MAHQYDVIIIGAGISGLICGNYLAREGLEVLILEQHSSAGGYCTSFRRQGFCFDIGVHYLGSIQRGALGKIFGELNVLGDLNLVQFDPTDKVILPDSATYIRSDAQQTICEFKKSFPNDAREVDSFFKFILQENPFSIYKKLRGTTFRSFLDSFFKNERIKCMISVLLGNFGIVADKATALLCISLFREYLLDPGYYPSGGMATVTNVLTKKFLKNGGEIIFNKKADEIVLGKDCIRGVRTANRTFYAKNVVASIDARSVFFDLLKINTREKRIISRLDPSPSMFAVYLGLNKDLYAVLKEPCNVWYFPDYNYERQFALTEEMVERQDTPSVMLNFPSFHDRNVCPAGYSIVEIFILTPYFNSKFWDKNRLPLAKHLIKISEKVLGKFSDNIVVLETATPITFENYTFNNRGATFGWASTVSQSSPFLLSQKCSVNGLFLAGHWVPSVTGQGGIPKVALSGKRAAGLVLHKLGKEIPFQL